MLSLSECIPWMAVGLAESIAIVTLNLCTIIVFMRNRYLRKRSTYLVINLAVIDMSVGGVVVHHLFHWVGVACNLWKQHLVEYRAIISIAVLERLFLFGSLTNIASIALERVHATYLPFRHRVLKKWVYGLIIALVWVKSGLASVTYTLIVFFEEIQYAIYFHITFFSIYLSIICVSYMSIVIKVCCGAQPQHHGAARRERKLTMTLLIMTVVSLLFYLPHVVFWFLISEIPRSVPNHLVYALIFLFLGNSLVNPILYVLRMPEYRSAFLSLFRRRAHQQRQVAPLPLRNM